MKKITSNTVIAVCALVVSICALVVSVQEMRTIRSQQEAMLYPHLTVSPTYNANGFEFYVKNSGTGLAIVDNMTVSMDGKVYDNWLEIIDEVMPDGHDIGYNIVRTNNLQTVITPSERVVLFGIPWNEETRQLMDNVGEIEIRVCYKSMLEDHWEISNQWKLPKKVKSCD